MIYNAGAARRQPVDGSSAGDRGRRALSSKGFPGNGGPKGGHPPPSGGYFLLLRVTVTFSGAELRPLLPSAVIVKVFLPSASFAL